MRECALLYRAMKKIHILFVVFVLATVSGCDFFRKVAGRPTSDEIEVKRAEIAVVEARKAEAAREQARQDSVKAEQERARLAEEAAIRDSLEALDELAQKGCQMYDLSSLKGLSSGELAHRYYVVIGSFRDAANADKFIVKVSSDTLMDPAKIHFRTGMIAVGVCPRNTLKDVADVIDDVRSRPYCPKDAWILVNGQ